MKLSNANLNSALFQEKNYTLPRYDRAQVLEKTAKTPVWVHMGAGNIARSFVSQIAQDTLDAGKMDTGLIICEGFDYEIIEKAYRPYDNLCINVILNPDGSVRKNVVGSLTESLVMDPAREDWARLKEIFVSPSLQMVSFTITEKGYNLKDLQGNYMPAVLEDFAVGTQAPKTYIGKVAALCYARYQAGALPLALVSMDNCSHNGKRLEDAVCDFAKHWAENGAADAGFAAYIAGNDKIAFPWTAIDKITPRPDLRRSDGRRSGRYGAGTDGPAHLCCAVCQRRADAVPRCGRSLPEWPSGPERKWRLLHGPQHGGEVRADEGLHLPQPAAYGAGRARLHAGLRAHFR